MELDPRRKIEVSAPGAPEAAVGAPGTPVSAELKLLSCMRAKSAAVITSTAVPVVVSDAGVRVAVRT